MTIFIESRGHFIHDSSTQILISQIIDVFYTEVLSELDRKYDPTHALENMVSNLNLAYYKRKEAIAAQASASAEAANVLVFKISYYI